MKKYAFIVGIEQYPQGIPALNGPCRDAIDFANWILEQEPDAGPRMFVFLAESAKPSESQIAADLAALTANGVTVHQSGTRKDILSALREKFILLPDEESELYFYWSGHGGTFHGSKRVLFFSDKGEDGPSHVYYETIFADLQDEVAKNFQVQHLIFDCCSNHLDPQNLGIRNALRSADTSSFAPISRWDSLFAAPIGDVAKTEKGSSRFTSTLLKELRGLNGWPIQFSLLLDRLRGQLGPVGCEVGDKQNGFSNLLPNHIESVVDALKKCLLTETQIRMPFVRTAKSDLKDMPSMVAYLFEFTADRTADNLPRPLIEFLMRLRLEYPAETVSVQTWLAKNTNDTVTRLTLEKELNDERKGFDLLMEIETKEKAGAPFPALCTARLYPKGFTGEPLCRWPTAEIAGRAELEVWIREIVVDDPCVSGSVAIHVYANQPHLLHVFHCWPRLPDDPIDPQPIGQFHALFLHLRERHTMRLQFPKDLWRKRLAALRAKPVGLIVRRDIGPNHNNPVGLDEFAWMDDVLSFDGREDSVAYRVLSKSLRTGVPLVGWRSHAGITPLTNVLATANLPEDLPRKLHDLRSNGQADDIVILWDDADWKPDAISSDATQGT